MGQSDRNITFKNPCASTEEVQAYNQLLKLMKESPIPDEQILGNLGLFLVRATLGRMLFMQKLYTKTLNTHGVIMEFGVRWGQNLGLFSALTSIYEPYNLTRKIIGFDTFEGFVSVGKEDGTSPEAKAGGLAVTVNYEEHLDQIMEVKQRLMPRGHWKRYELVKGDVLQTLPEYLEKHPETIISLAFFDLDLYEPTKKCLELIRPYLAKNSIVGFDQLAWDIFPGETQALREAWGTSDFDILRELESPQQCYIVMK
ncbi:MAG TPA: crotonobetainyl-CoA--carnitine CoA-transferase [bacterium]|nr:crotonobetainyl-CoA--carnitine CoA-transferase [bacterium]